MKKLFFFILVILLGISSKAQQDSLQPPYKRFPTVPPFQLQLVDSTTIFTKEKLQRKTPVMIMLFNPQCEHCQQEIQEIIKNIKDFKKIQIVLATTMPLDSLRKFYIRFELFKYQNIIAGCDKSYFLVSFYFVHNFPYLAFYNKKWGLISTFEGSLPIPKILETFGLD